MLAPPLALGALIAVLLTTGSALGAVGALTQKAGTAACVSETGTAGACADGNALITSFAIAISPDGKNAYAAAYGSDAIVIFDRNLTTGALTQKAGTAGCISETGTSGTCVDGKALDSASSVSVSPDGASVYVASTTSDAVAVFDRNASTGALTQKAGTAGCISETGTFGTCVDGKALDGAFSVSTSADNKNVYVASSTSDAVAVFDRNTATGALTQKAGTAGCVSETGTTGSCVDGKALDGAISVTTSANGSSVYVASTTSDAVAVFDRNTTTGVLTQKPGTAGCVSETGTSGTCVDGKALDGAFSVVASAGGTSLYAVSSTSDALAVFDRSTSTGAITQKAGTAGCISETGTFGACVDGKALDGVFSVAISADGASVYTAAPTSSAVAVLDRATATGALTQRAGTAGCVSETGSAGACADGVALASAGAVTVSPDDATVYATAYTSDAVSVFDRDLAPQTTIDSGASGPTADNTPTFTFSSSDAGSTFECRIDAAAFAPCSGSGTHTTATLTDGAHTFQVRAVDLASTPDPTPASRSFSVDTTPPQTTIDSGPSGLTADNTPTFGFSSNDPGSSFQCRIDTAAFAACSGPGASHTTAPLTDGLHTVEVRAADALGNPDATPASRSFTVDADPPETTIDSGPSGPTADNTPTFGFSSDEGGSSFQCKVDAGAWGPCSGPGAAHTAGALADGTHSFEVRATDPAGNTDPTPAARTVTVDTTTPQTTIDSGPSGPTNDPTPTFAFSSDEGGSSFQCRIDGGTFAACSGPGDTHTTAPLATGSHTFEVRATDPAGNADPTSASRSFTVDTTSPQTTIDSAPGGLIADATPSFQFSSTEAGSAFQCRIDAAAFASCSGPGGAHTTAALADGAHTFEVRATDPAGNVDPSPASASFIVDATAPATTIDSGPQGPTADPTATFTFSSNEAGSSFQCRIDSEAFAACTGSGTHTTSALTDGAHTFEVRATDPAGNVDPSPASRAISVDVTPPQTTIDSGPTGPTADSTPTFQFSSDEAGTSFECRVDSDAFAACSGPGAGHTTAALADGAHSFEVRAIDALGNVDPTPATRNFTVDDTPPDTVIDSGPSGLTNQTTATFGFSSEAGASFQCKLDAGTWGGCTGPGNAHTIGSLSNGPHTFSVRANDSLGNVDPTPATSSFTIDSTSPQTSVDSGPNGTTADATPSFGFSADETGSSFECRVDAQAFGPCSGPADTHTTSSLSDGPHTFAVRATDPAGNTDGTAAIRSFTVDTTAPETSVNSGPSGTTADATPTFGFSSGEAGSSFECRIDTDAFGPCSGPGATHTASALNDGPHTFDVRATDAVGNVDPTAASRAFTVDATAPQTAIDSGPTGMVGDATPTFGFSSGEAGSTFQCRVDAAGWSSCSGPGDTHTTISLADGPHTFEVRATDAVGNTDGTPAEASFTVETRHPQTTIDSGPSGPTSDTTPTFAFSADEPASFECKIDAGAWGPCSGPAARHTSAPLSDGSHSFAVRATDTVANVDASPATSSFTVDTVAPGTTIDSGPSGVTTENAGTFTFSSNEAGATFACKVDSAAWGACSGPGARHSLVSLSDGPHTFAVRARDGAGNTDASPASGAFTVDTTAPETTIDSGPDGPVNDNTPTFAFSSGDAEASFECAIDAGTFEACSGPDATHTAGTLADGDHTFSVRAIDPASTPDASPAVREFTVDTVAPETSFVRKPKKKRYTSKKTMKIKIPIASSEEGSSFQCKLGKKAFQPCSSPLVVKARSKPGKGKRYTLAILAVDAAGNVDPKSATARFRLIRKE